MYAEERRQALVAWTRGEGRVSVLDAAGRFDVTPETIRRDLEALDRGGVVRRVHGGAMPPEVFLLGDLALSERDVTAAPQKDRIAAAAARFAPSAPASVLLDAGTTTARLANLLPAALSVHTDSVSIAATLSQRGVDVRICGGQVRGLTQACVGAQAVADIARLKVDVAFVGTNGLTLSHGLSTPDAEESYVKAQIVRSAHRVVVLADSRKLGAEHAHSFAAVDDIDVLVTDDQAPEAFRQQLQPRGIEVVVA